MRSVPVKNIVGGEILVKDIYSTRGVILIASGTKMKKEYIDKLVEANISDIMVEDNVSEEIIVDDISEEMVAVQCENEFQSIMEKYTYSTNEELSTLKKIASEIIEEMFERKEIIYTISNVREKSREIYSHSLSVAALSTLLAIKSGFSKDAIKEITLGALLHDIGFMSLTVPYNGVILEEADDNLQREIKRHVIYGYTLVEEKDWVGKISKEIILYHHERIDKSGYPFKLSGEKIHKEVKIVAICDEFDNCVYGNFRKKMKAYEAMEYIVGMSGTKFDFTLVKKFADVIAAYPTGSIVLMNTNEKGIVVRQNKGAPTRPVVRMIEKKENGEWTKKEERDLMVYLSLFIIDIIDE